MDREPNPSPSLPKFAMKIFVFCENSAANLRRVPEAGGVGLALPEFPGDLCDLCIEFEGF